MVGNTWALKVYSGKTQTGVREIGLARNVCIELMKDLIGQGRTLYVDNFYTSDELTNYCLRKPTHHVGTLCANKKHILKEVLQAKLKRGEMVAKEDQQGVVILKWKDTRDARVLSTNDYEANHTTRSTICFIRRSCIKKATPKSYRKITCYLGI